MLYLLSAAPAPFLIALLIGLVTGWWTFARRRRAGGPGRDASLPS